VELPGNVLASFPVHISKFLLRVKYTPVTIPPVMLMTDLKSILSHLSPSLKNDCHEVSTFPSMARVGSYPISTLLDAYKVTKLLLYTILQLQVP
jgi:hypothetical protein